MSGSTKQVAGKRWPSKAAGIAAFECNRTGEPGEAEPPVERGEEVVLGFEKLPLHLRKPSKPPGWRK